MFNRSRAWAAGLLVAAFAAGAAVGAATRAFGARATEGREPERGPRLSYIERLDRDLTLRQAQRDSIAGILERHNATNREISQRARESFDTLRLRVRSEIMTVLDLNQQDLFRTINARNDSVRAEREKGRRNDRD